MFNPHQVSHVRCQVSGVTCNYFIYLFLFISGQSGEASWWRVCFQRGLPSLVFFLHLHLFLMRLLLLLLLRFAKVELSYYLFLSSILLYLEISILVEGTAATRANF